MKTEEHYLRDLNLCMQVFNSDQGEKVYKICWTQEMVIVSYMSDVKISYKKAQK